jgi:hypothetical protein
MANFFTGIRSPSRKSPAAKMLSPAANRLYWGAFIKRVHEVDPLFSSEYSDRIKVVSLIELSDTVLAWLCCLCRHALFEMAFLSCRLVREKNRYQSLSGMPSLT